MAIKLQAINDIKREINKFLDDSIKNVNNATVPKDIKGFNVTVEKSLYTGRMEGLEAAKKAINSIIDRTQEEGGFR